MENYIHLNQLKAGDLMLFTAPDSPLSQLIAKLTHSTVSHAGIADYNPVYVLNEQEEGAVRSILNPPNERSIYIRRLHSCPDTGKVADIALKYIDEKLPYPMTNLIFVGIYILTEDILPDSELSKLISTLVKYINYKLIKYINAKKDPNVTPMVCSQFALHCYDKAAKEYGREYLIKFNKKDTSSKSIINQVKNYEIPVNFTPNYNMNADMEFNLTESDFNNLCSQIIRKIDDKNTISDNNDDDISNSVISSDFVSSILTFAHLLNGRKNSTAKDLLNNIIDMRETFTTPADLLMNTTNVDDLGILLYTQEELDSYRDK